jgi:hypothetical protein
MFLSPFLPRFGLIEMEYIGESEKAAPRQQNVKEKKTLTQAGDE